MTISTQLLISAIAVLSAAKLASGQASVVNEVILSPYSATITVGCADPDDVVQVTGFARTRFKTVVDSNGGVHQEVHTFMSFEGIMQPSGAYYHGTGKDFFLSNQSPTSAHNELTSFVDTVLIGQGSASNLILRTQLHTTVLANNEITADVVNVSAVCK